MNRLRFALPIALVAGLIGYFAWTRMSEAPEVATWAPPMPVNPRAVAVFPFQVSSPRWKVLGNGIAHLLGARLGGNGDLRRVSPQAVWSRVQRSPAAELDPKAAAAIATDLGARSYVLGSLTVEDENARLAAQWYDTADAAPKETSTVEGPLEKLTDLVDRLGAKLIADQVAADAVHVARVSVVTSDVPEAVRLYLDAETDFAGGHYAETVDKLDKAVQTDPQFALAYFRLAQVAAWQGMSAVASSARQQALLLSNRLPTEERRLIDIELEAMRGERGRAEQRYRDLVAVAPDEWQAWLDLSELTQDPATASAASKKAFDLLPEQPALRARADARR